jgi:hypothetical protein
MTVEHAVDTSTMRDELRQAASMLCTRFPARSRSDVERLLTDVYQALSDNARIRSHLIPLTLNRCRRLLHEAEYQTRSANCPLPQHIKASS